MNPYRPCALVVGILVSVGPVLAQSGTKPSKNKEPEKTPSGAHLVLEKKQPFGEIYALAFSPDSKFLASGHKDRVVLLWDVQTGKEVMSLRHGDQVHAVVFSPDGKLLATGSDQASASIKLWAWGAENADPPRGKLLATLDHHRCAVRSLAFSPDSKLLASGGSGMVGGVKLWDVAAAKERFNFNTVSKGSVLGGVPVTLGGVVGAVTFSTDGKQVGAVCAHHARVWDVATGRERVTIGPFGHWAALSPGYVLVGSRGQDQYIGGSAAFTTDGKNLITTWCHQTQNNPGTNVGYYVGAQGPGLGWKGVLDCSPLKSWTLTTRQGRSPLQFRQQEVLLIDKVIKQPKRFGVGSDGVLCFAYAADGKRIVTGGTQLQLTGKETRFEDVLSRVERNENKGPQYVVKLWDTAKGNPVAVLKGHIRHIRAVAYAPDRAWVASGGFDLRLWNVARAVAEANEP